MSDLLQRMKDLNSRLNQKKFEDKKKHSGSRIGQMQDDISKLHRFWYQFTLAFGWAYSNVFSPIGNFLWKPVKWLFNLYRRVWSLTVYKPNEYGVLLFSKTRAGMFLTATLAVLYFIGPILNLTYDAALYFATVKKEVVFLTNSQEIIPDYDTHSIQGCTQRKCTEDDSIYYRVNPSLFNHLWSFYHNGTWFYPDYVAAAVTPGRNICHIIDYGLRLKFLMRGADIYPDILSVSCEPDRDY